jgi:hypothetical protein
MSLVVNSGDRLPFVVSCVGSCGEPGSRGCRGSGFGACKLAEICGWKLKECHSNCIFSLRSWKVEMGLILGHGEFVVIMIRGSFLHVRTLKVVAAAAAMDEVASCMVLLMSLDSVHWSPDFWTSLPPSHFSISVVN